MCYNRPKWEIDAEEMFTKGRSRDMKKKGIMTRLVVTALAAAIVVGTPAAGMGSAEAATVSYSDTAVSGTVTAIPVRTTTNTTNANTTNTKKKTSVLDQIKKSFEEYRNNIIKKIQQLKTNTGKLIGGIADEAEARIKRFVYDVTKPFADNIAKLKAIYDDMVERINKLIMGDRDKFSNEWVQGKWYDKNGRQTYWAIGEWKKDSKGWWFQDASGWYPKNRWQKINGRWYYFKADGYMAESEFCNGYWVDRSGAWTYIYKASWKKDSKGWRYIDTTGWYAAGATYTIDGIKCRFDAKGYLIED